MSVGNRGGYLACHLARENCSTAIYEPVLGRCRGILTIITENRKNELNRKKNFLPPPEGGEMGVAW